MSKALKSMVSHDVSKKQDLFLQELTTLKQNQFQVSPPFAVWVCLSKKFQKQRRNGENFQCMQNFKKFKRPIYYFRNNISKLDMEYQNSKNHSNI